MILKGLYNTHIYLRSDWSILGLTKSYLDFTVAVLYKDMLIYAKHQH